jgi:membrane-associated phospholipid phosphatase
MLTRSLAIAVIAILSVQTLPARADAGSDAVLEWNQIMVTTVGGQNPFAQARIAAITQLAVFEAVNAITHDHASYLVPLTAPAGASAEAAAVAAAHDVLVNYIPAAASTLDAAQEASLAAIPDGASEDDGIAIGQAAAAEMIALRAADGSSPPQFFQPSSSDPGVWQPTPTCPPAGGILFHWQKLTPFAVMSSAQFRSAPPPALGSPQYALAYDELTRVGAIDSTERPADRADVARLYNSLLAVGVWNSVGRQLAQADPLSLSEHARVFALLNMAMSDALATVMETKYHYAFWRPETAIRAGDLDGNDRTVADADYVPYIPTPCFPSYPSAHASASYAGRSILQRVWGSAGHALEISTPSVPGVLVHYTSLRQITDDIDDARIYGGIHFRFDQEAGGTQGRKIGQYVFANYLQATGQ